MMSLGNFQVFLTFIQWYVHWKFYSKVFCNTHFEIESSWISISKGLFFTKGHNIPEWIFLFLVRWCYMTLKGKYYALKTFSLIFEDDEKKRESSFTGYFPSHSFSMSDLFWMMDWLSRWSISFLREGHWRTVLYTMERASCMLKKC